MRRDQRSQEAQAYRHLYKTRRWRRIRERQLAVAPLCERCLARGTITPATVCHHKDPDTKRDPATFYKGPFASLCASCHDGPVQSEERTGYSSEVDADGYPVDPRHPFNAAR